MVDYAAARLNMVESQVRTNKVTDEALLAALGEIERERFVPNRLSGVAYVDEDLEIAPGRYLMEPMVLARMLHVARIGPEDVVLDVGCGTGYASAVMARLAGTVVALEADQALADEATRTLSEVGADNAIVVTGPLAQGFARQGPYDVILFGGAIHDLPALFVDQLAEGGRIVAVRRGSNGLGEAVLWAKLRGTLSSRALFEAAVPPLPEFAPAPAFEF